MAKMMDPKIVISVVGFAGLCGFYDWRAGKTEAKTEKLMRNTFMNTLRGWTTWMADSITWRRE